MHNWTNFCNIIKFNLKSQSLVAHVAAGLFLDNESCSWLEGKTAYVVPPELDLEREIKLINVNKIDDDKFSFDLTNAEWESLVGKSLLMSENDAKLVFGETSLRKDDDLIGKTVVDEMLGKIGKIEDVAGTSAQKHLIVDYEGFEVLIPFASDLIKEEREHEILMMLPEGLINVNKA